MRRTRVLLVTGDDDLLQRLDASVARDPRVAVVGRARTAEAAIVGIRSLKPDMVWMDVALPDADGSRLAVLKMKFKFVGGRLPRGARTRKSS